MKNHAVVAQAVGALVLLFLSASSTQAQSQETSGESAKTAETQELTAFQVRHGDLAALSASRIPFESLRVRDAPSPNNEFDKLEHYDRAGNATKDTGVAWTSSDRSTRGGEGAGLTMDLEWESIDLNDVGVLTGFLGTPPDTMGAVGPTQFFTTQNSMYRVHNKTTGAVIAALDIIDSDFWVPAVDSNDSGGGDPRVRFDRINNRWVVIAFTTSPLANNRILLALSDGPTISAGTVWTQYFFVGKDTVGSTLPNNCFVDYPMLGVDVNAIYVGGNIFQCGAVSTAVFVLPNDTADLPVGGGNASSVTTGFTGLLAGVANVWAPMPADNTDPNATMGYVIGHQGNSDTILRLGKISNPGGPAAGPGNPTIAWSDVTVSNKNDGYGCGVPYVGNPTTPCVSNGTVVAGEWGLDPLGFRPLGGAQIAGGHLWTAMTSSVNGPGGALRLFPATGDRHSVVFFEIDVATNALVQDGNVFDRVTAENTRGGGDPMHVWMGSVGVNGQGHAVVGASGANTLTTAPSAVWAGRLATDPLGNFSSAEVYHPGIDTGDFRMDFENDDRATRWGDYAQVTIDPCDDMTFYSIAEYQDSPAISPTRGNWATAVARILAPAPTFAGATDAQSGLGSSTTTVTGTGFYDPPIAGMPPCRVGISASSSTPGVSVNGVTFTSPTSVDIDLDTSGTAAGSAMVILTNPDGQEIIFAVNLASSDAIFADGFESGDTTAW